MSQDKYCLIDGKLHKTVRCNALETVEYYHNKYDLKIVNEHTFVYYLDKDYDDFDKYEAMFKTEFGSHCNFIAIGKIVGVYIIINEDEHERVFDTIKKEREG